MSNLLSKVFFTAVLLALQSASAFAASQEESFSEGIARTKQRLVYVDPQSGWYKPYPITQAQKKMAVRVDAIFKNNAIKNPLRVTAIGVLVVSLGEEQTHSSSVKQTANGPQVTCGDASLDPALPTR
jgi:hypothetical protein